VQPHEGWSTRKSHHFLAAPSRNRPTPHTNSALAEDYNEDKEVNDVTASIHDPLH
jgi:hypothetical protein